LTDIARIEATSCTFSVIFTAPPDAYKSKKKLSHVHMQRRFQINYVIFILEGRIIYLSNEDVSRAWMAWNYDMLIVIGLVLIFIVI